MRNKAPLKIIWKAFCRKLQGHAQYYGISFNSTRVTSFLYRAVLILFKWLNRRSQRKSFNWESFELFIKRYTEKPSLNLFFCLTALVVKFIHLIVSISLLLKYFKFRNNISFSKCIYLYRSVRSQ